MEEAQLVSTPEPAVPTSAARKLKFHELDESHFDQSRPRKKLRGTPVPSPNCLSEQNSPELTPTTGSARVPEVAEVLALPQPLVSTHANQAALIKAVRDKVAALRALSQLSRSQRQAREAQLRQLEDNVQDAQYQLTLFATDLAKRKALLDAETAKRRAAEAELERFLLQRPSS